MHLATGTTLDVYNARISGHTAGRRARSPPHLGIATTQQGERRTEA